MTLRTSNSESKFEVESLKGKVTANEVIKVISSWKVGRVTSNHDQNDHRLTWTLSLSLSLTGFMSERLSGANSEKNLL